MYLTLVAQCAWPPLRTLRGLCLRGCRRRSAPSRSDDAEEFTEEEDDDDEVARRSQNLTSPSWPDVAMTWGLFGL